MNNYALAPIDQESIMKSLDVQVKFNINTSYIRNLFIVNMTQHEKPTLFWDNR